MAGVNAGQRGLRYAFGTLRLDSPVPLPGFDHRLAASATTEHGRRFAFRLVTTAEPAVVSGPVVVGGLMPGRLAIRRYPGGHVFTAAGFAACTLLADRETLRWHLSAPPTAADAEFLVSTVLPRVASAQGALVLHAATLAAPCGAVLLCGASGAGKSTLCSAVAASTGWGLIGDDAVALDLTPGHAAASHPDSSRPDSDHGPVLAYGFNPDVRTRVSQLVGATKHRTTVGQPPIGAVPAMVVIRLVPGRPELARRVPRPTERLIALRDNVLRLDRVDPQAAIGELAALAALTRRVPVVELQHARTSQSIQATAEEIAMIGAGR